ncbi:hypothetical protein D3C72_2225870 [compost metagenome]
MQFALLVAGNDDGLATDRGGVVVVVVRNLAFVCQIDPVRFKEVLHLQFEQLGVGEYVAAAAKDTGLLVVLHRRFQQRLDSVVFVSSSRVHGRVSLGCSHPPWRSATVWL